MDSDSAGVVLFDFDRRLRGGALRTAPAGAESYDSAASGTSEEEIQVSWTSYGSLASSAPRDRTPNFKLRDTYLRSREISRAGHRYFIVTRPDWTVQRFRQNPQSGEAEPVDSIPGGDPES